MEKLKRDLEHIKKDGIDSGALFRRVRKYLKELAEYKETGLTQAELLLFKTVKDIALDTPAIRLVDILFAERAGRLVVLPVEPWLGPTQQNEMYIRENGEVWAIYVTGCEAGPNADGVFTVMYTTLDGDVFSADDIGKTVFLTRQEAEAALERWKEHNT